MKRIVYLISVAILVATVITSCNKNRDYPNIEDHGMYNNSGSSSGSGSFLAKIDGAQFSATVATGQLASSGQLSIIATKGTETFQISITNPVVGEVTVDNSSCVFYYSPDQTVSNNFYFPPTTAKVHITQYDVVAKKVSGSFAFTATKLLGTENKVLTDGVFTNISFTTPTVTPTTTNTMSALIDGTPFSIGTISGNSVAGGIQVAGATGSFGSFPSITLAIPSTADVGDHDFSSLTGYSLTYTESATVIYSTGFAITPGKVTITSHNTTSKEISGTFDGSVSDLMGSVVKTVTGAFTVIYN